MNFGQIVTAMIAPFSEDGSLDLQATTTLIDHLHHNHTDTLVVNGTTGEAPVLTAEEKKQLLQTAIAHSKGRMNVIAGVGSNNTQQSIELAKEAEALGADGIMVVVPYYNKPSQEGIYQHMVQIADAVSLPVMLYNVPGRTGVDMSVETTLRLATHRNVFAIKEASGSMDKVSAIIRQSPPHFSVYSGDDSLTLPMLSLGAKGVVSVASHIIGTEMKQMISAFESGDVKLAASMQSELFPVMQALFMAPNPTPVKAALKTFGIPCGGVRLPLVPLTELENSALQSVISPFVPHSAFAQ
ncbi:4-hydroxy-tetrahydrodipicolinate synthase [Bacillus sp. JCM 19041]|uniref:4-hydroxy-tetrahydrodipicolinate synthase n=1 Tax=Bacillus sp. JCM 19041 TaxID=1460637 RepID=UPI0006D1E3FF